MWQALKEVLDILPTPLWLLQGDGRIEFASSAARALAAQDQGWLHVHHQQDHQQVWRVGHMPAHEWQRLLAAAEPARRLVWAHRGERPVIGTVQLTPLDSASACRQWWPLARWVFALELPHPWTDEQLAHLVNRYALTLAQRNTLKLLVEGRSVDDIATTLQVKVGTVRSHLHELLSKTGCTRQLDLVLLALGR